MRGAAAVLLVTLMGCSERAPSPGQASPAPAAARGVAEADGGAAPSAQGPDLSHVRVGQRYLFRLQEERHGQAEMVWEVTATGPEQVSYSVTVMRGGVALGPPGASVWRAPRPGAPADSSPSETIELAGRVWECRVIQLQETRTWTAVSGGVESFPPLLQQVKGDAVCIALARIEEPR